MIGSSQEVTRKEHIETLEAKRVQSVDAFGGLVTEGNYDTLVDTASDTIIYIGKAQLSTAEATAGWQIQKIDVSTPVVKIRFADGTDDFVKKWTDRATYTYV